MNVFTLVLLSILVSILAACWLILFFLFAARKSKYIRGALIELTGLSTPLNIANSVYVRLLNQKEKLKETLMDSIGKSHEQVFENIEKTYEDLDKEILDLVKKMEDWKP